MATTQAAFDSILKAVEFEELPQEEQDAFLEELNSIVFRGAVLRTVERMDERTRDAWYHLIESGASDEKMQQFLAKRAPHAELALAETVEMLADDILAVTNN
ncbi:MAG: hypothetical protein ACM3TU_02920 [Bacillota bacterium]